MWGRETMAGLAHGGVANGNRVDADVGYGLPVGSRFVWMTSPVPTWRIGSET